MAYFADATFLVALFNRADAHHKEAVETMARVAKEGGSSPPLVFTDYVFDEVITTVLYKTRRPDRAEAAGRMLREAKAARMVSVASSTFERAWDLFADRHDKMWSFTDCTSFTVMKEVGIRIALTFDSDFEEAGFASIP